MATGPALRIAFLGPKDSFSDLAARKHAPRALGAAGGGAKRYVPVASISAVFRAVSAGECDYGVVPLENSTHGRVTDTLEALTTTDVRIVAEAPLRIHHCLLGRGPLAAVERVASKPQALDQCKHWLAERLPAARLEPCASTSEAAAIASNDPAVAAIASEQAGKAQGLKVLARNIEDQPDNLTRFAVIGRADGGQPAATGDDKTSLVFEVPHQPGSLADALAIFKRQKLNLTWIESFPIPGSRTSEQSGGRFVFFVEFQGHERDEPVARALKSLARKSVYQRVLGTYARIGGVG
ncbi:MAG: prephenate dehydratase [Lacipirellulaceae bacterium]